MPLYDRNPRNGPDYGVALGGGGAPASGGVAPAPSGPPQPVTAPSSNAPGYGQGSGAFTDLSAYLRANGGEARGLADSIVGGLSSEAAQAAQTPTWAPSPVASSNGGIGGAINTSVANSFVPVVNQINATAADRVNQTRAKATSDLAADPQTLLSQRAGPGYTPGQATLDNYLFNAAGGDRSMADLRSRYASLLGAVTAPTYTGATEGPAWSGTPHPAQPAPPQGSTVPTAQGSIGTPDSRATGQGQNPDSRANGNGSRPLLRRSVLSGGW